MKVETKAFFLRKLSYGGVGSAFLLYLGRVVSVGQGEFHLESTQSEAPTPWCYVRLYSADLYFGRSYVLIIKIVLF